MRVSRYYFIKTLYILFDVLVISVSLYLICWIRQAALPFTVTPYGLFLDPSNPFRSIFVFWILTIIFLNNAHGLYVTKREIFETVEIWQVLRSVFLSALIMVSIIFFAKIVHFPRSVLFLGSAAIFLVLSLWRVLKRIFVEYLVAQGYNNFNVLIIGAGKIGTALAHEIKKQPALGLHITGYLDDFKKNQPGDPIKILGKISEFSEIARKEFITKVFITCHHSGDVFLKLLEEAKVLGIAVRVIPHGFELMSGEFSKYNIGFIPILEYSDAQRFRKQVGKRLFDFIVATILTLGVSPVFLLIGILIKWDSPGPVFYCSSRYGRGGRIFHMYKFRSMKVDAEKLIDKIRDKNEADGPIFKIKKDPRITRIGVILRKYSIDELPQLLNVIKGDMSLVGPRPLPMSQVEKEDFRQLQRLEVRPGMTGLWQIRGRSDLSFVRLVKWDVWYINNWSFWLDMNILFKTIPVVARGQGAY